jgi:hypothetical protein|tara:strand:- start:120 stop:269 length:150 start_codon:yes stop_codon:yes gene_type:complete
MIKRLSCGLGVFLDRKIDEIIIAKLDGSTNYTDAGTDGLSKDKFLEAFE